MTRCDERRSSRKCGTITSQWQIQSMIDRFKITLRRRKIERQFDLDRLSLVMFVSHLSRENFVDSLLIEDWIDVHTCLIKPVNNAWFDWWIDRQEDEEVATVLSDDSLIDWSSSLCSVFLAQSTCQTVPRFSLWCYYLFSLCIQMVNSFDETIELLFFFISQMNNNS